MDPPNSKIPPKTFCTKKVPIVPIPICPSELVRNHERSLWESIKSSQDLMFTILFVKWSSMLTNIAAKNVSESIQFRIMDKIDKWIEFEKKSVMSHEEYRAAALFLYTQKCEFTKRDILKEHQFGVHYIKTNRMFYPILDKWMETYENIYHFMICNKSILFLFRIMFFIIPSIESGDILSWSFEYDM